MPAPAGTRRRRAGSLPAGPHLGPPAQIPPGGVAGLPSPTPGASKRETEAGGGRPALPGSRGRGGQVVLEARSLGSFPAFRANVGVSPPKVTSH